MRIEQVKQILAIEQYNSISKASKELYISQPSLSATLSNFEKEIGLSIFTRDAYGVKPTQDGEEILALMKQLISYSDAILNYKLAKEELNGEVTLLITFAYVVIYPDIMMKFKKEFPYAKLNIKILPPSNIIDEIAINKMGIGFTVWQSIKEQNEEVLKMKNLVFKSYNAHNMCLYTSAKSKLANFNTICFKQLTNEQFVIYDTIYWEHMNSMIKSNKLPIVINDRETIKNLIAEGKAVIYAPDTCKVKDWFCKEGTIKTIVIENFLKPRDYIVHYNTRQLTTLEKGLIKILTDEAKKLY